MSVTAGERDSGAPDPRDGACKEVDHAELFRLEKRADGFYLRHRVTRELVHVGAAEPRLRLHEGRAHV